MRFVLPVVLLVASMAARAYEFDFETIVSGVDHPTSLIFLDGTTALLTERNGGLRYLRNGTLDPTGVRGVPEVLVAGQAGLFDVLKDPQFEQNHTIYLSYAQGGRHSNTLKIARAKLSEYELVDLKVIFEGKPSRDSAFHYGGRMLFLPDGTLLFSCGEGFEYREQAQSLDNHLGKTLRINTDGSVPDDNPFVGLDGAMPEIYSYGHRNPQGLVLGANNEIYMHEHGPRGGDELNIIEPGKNYGWPVITYGVDYSGAHVSPYSSYPGMEQPLLHWTPSIAPGGMTRYAGEEFPSWRGNLLVAAMVEKSVRRIVVDGRRILDQEILFTDLDLELRDVRQGPDGEVYLLTNAQDGQVIRVTARD